MRMTPSWRAALAVGCSTAAIGCGGATDVTVTGAIGVSVTTAGPEPDPNGYRVGLDGRASLPLRLEDSTTFQEVTVGSHGVELTDVAANCEVSGGSVRAVTLPAGATEHVAFEVACAATAALRVVTRSEGDPADPDGYQLEVKGRGARPIGANASITMTGFLPGTLGVQLTGVAGTCTVTGPTGRLPMLVAGDTVEVTFEVRCAPPPPGDGTIVVTVQTQTVNASTPSGYTLTLDGGGPTRVAATQSVTLAHVPAGMHSLELLGMPPWCIAGSGGFPGSNPVQVSVIAGSVATVAFGVLCLG